MIKNEISSSTGEKNVGQSISAHLVKDTMWKSLGYFHSA